MLVARSMALFTVHIRNQIRNLWTNDRSRSRAVSTVKGIGPNRARQAISACLRPRLSKILRLSWRYCNRLAQATTHDSPNAIDSIARLLT